MSSNEARKLTTACALLAPVSVRECLILLAHGSVYDFKGNERHEMAALYLLIDVAVKALKEVYGVLVAGQKTPKLPQRYPLKNTSLPCMYSAYPVFLRIVHA